MLRHRRALIVAAGLASALVVVLVAPAAAATVDVTVADNLFQAPSVTVTAGDTVVWTKPGSRVHNVTADDGSFSSGDLAAGRTFSRVFNTPGTFRYHCSIHGAPGGIGMSGVVGVQAAQAPTTTAAATTTTTSATPTTTAAASTTPTTAAATTATTAGSQVLSASATSGEEATASAAPATAPGALASTGLVTLPLLAIAVALLTMGVVLVRRAATLARKDDAGGR